VRHAVAIAEVVEKPRTLDTQTGLEGVGRVVDSGVNHLAVVRARAHAGPRLTFEHTDAVTPAGDGQRCRQADHTCADDGCFDVVHQFVRGDG
jgi:hypothetical protein